MAASNRIRAPFRANLSRMPAEADSASSTPEFLIRRNLILRKRSTSDSEERPPSSGSSPQSSIGSEAFKPEWPRKKGVHPGHHQSQSSSKPRVSRDVAVHASASHPVPWNGHTSSPKTHDVGGGRGGTSLGLISKSGYNMGEESCCDHVRADDPVPIELIKTGETTDPQEFRYGPGFVDKLKSRFISLSLQEKAEKQLANAAVPAQGTMRRYSSLENVLEQDDYLDFTKRKRPIGALAFPNSRATNSLVPTRNSFKRAKSMETLLLESEHNMRHRNLSNNAFTNNNNNISTSRLQRPLSACEPISGSVLINENLVIIETVQPKGADLTDKISKKKSTARQVSVTAINDEELPKPDFVKTCKLIFEPVSKRPVAHSSVRKAPVLRQSAKLKGPPTQSPNNQGKVLSSIQPNGINSVSIAQQKCSAKENIINGEVPPPPKDSEVKSISSDALGRIRAQGISMTFNGSQKGKPTACQAHTPETAPCVKPTVPPPSPPLPLVKAVEKSVVSKELMLDVEIKPPQPVTQNGELVRPVSPLATTPNGLSPTVGSESDRAMKTLPNGIVHILEDSKPEPPNEEVFSQNEDAEEPEILKPTPLLGRSKPGGLWQKAPPPTNTIVYDFRGKEVKSHLPTNPAPFGCKPVKKNKKPVVKPVALANGTAGMPEPSTILLLGDFGESRDYDQDEDYDSDEVDVGAHLPALSGITFVGENIRSGKSCLLNTRNKKLKIQFVEKTSTFEYPPEETEPSWSPQEDHSLLLMNGVSSGPPNGALPPPPPPDPEEEEDETSTLQPPAPLLRQNMAVASSGGLSNYTPSMLSTSSENLQLGVERLVPEENRTPQDSSPMDSSTSSTLDPSTGLLSTNPQPGDSDTEVLKPADPADMSSWSSSTSTSDLLF